MRSVHINKLSAGFKVGLHMTAETRRGLQMLASIHMADCMLQISHDNSLPELAQLCASSQWIETYKGRLERMRLYRQQKYHDDAAYRKAVIHSNNARTLLKRQDPEYRAHEAALQRRRRQNAKASLKTVSL